jgi:hypothetical protein
MVVAEEEVAAMAAAAEVVVVDAVVVEDGPVETLLLWGALVNAGKLDAKSLGDCAVAL